MPTETQEVINTIFYSAVAFEIASALYVNIRATYEGFVNRAQKGAQQ